MSSGSGSRRVALEVKVSALSLLGDGRWGGSRSDAFLEFL
jgi:hypothetical protein